MLKLPATHRTNPWCRLSENITASSGFHGENVIPNTTKHEFQSLINHGYVEHIKLPLVEMPCVHFMFLKMSHSVGRTQTARIPRQHRPVNGGVNRSSSISNLAARWPPWVLIHIDTLSRGEINGYIRRMTGHRFSSYHRPVELSAVCRDKT